MPFIRLRGQTGPRKLAVIVPVTDDERPRTGDARSAKGLGGIIGALCFKRSDWGSLLFCLVAADCEIGNGYYICPSAICFANYSTIGSTEYCWSASLIQAFQQFFGIGDAQIAGYEFGEQCISQHRKNVTLLVVYINLGKIGITDSLIFIQNGLLGDSPLLWVLRHFMWIWPDRTGVPRGYRSGRSSR